MTDGAGAGREHANTVHHPPTPPGRLQYYFSNGCIVCRGISVADLEAALGLAVVPVDVDTPDGLADFAEADLMGYPLPVLDVAGQIYSGAAVTLLLEKPEGAGAEGEHVCHAKSCSPKTTVNLCGGVNPCTD